MNIHEAIERVTLMSRDDSAGRWDFSPNDRRALAMVLERMHDVDAEVKTNEHVGAGRNDAVRVFCHGRSIDVAICRHDSARVIGSNILAAMRVA